MGDMTNDIAKDGTGLNLILDRVHDELADLAICADGLQNLIGELARRTSPPIEDAMREDLQSVDALVQRLLGLVQLLRLLGAAVPMQWTLAPSWSEGSRLPSSARALCAPAKSTAPAAGDCEFF